MSTGIPIFSLLLRIVLLIISVLAVGFFAGAETAFLAMDKWVISTLAGEGDRGPGCSRASKIIPKTRFPPSW